MENTMKDRLLAFVQYKRMSVRQFQERIGVSGSYIANIVNGVGRGVMLRIEREFPELNTEWLVFGEGDMIQSTDDANVRVGRLIPVLPTCSIGCLLEDFLNNYESSGCEMFVSPLNDADLAISVTDDSMMPEYANGSKVIVKRIDPNVFIDWGRTFALDTTNGIIIKKIMPSADKNFVTCVSVDNRFPSFDVEVVCIRGFYKVLMCVTMK